MNISRSIRRLTNVFLILFVALSAGLVYWQVVVAPQVTSNPTLNYTRSCTSEAAPDRGRIFDRNGVLLAYSVKSNAPGMCGYKRVYTAAAQGLEGLIGYYINPSDSSTGVEAQFNDYLDGKNGLTGLDNSVNQILHVPPQGDDIYLTVDSRIEKILVSNFNIEVPANEVPVGEVYTTDRGSVIVSDPSTGEILGIISEPGYDANCVVECSLDTLRTDMLAKNYNKTLGCPGSCTMDQFTTALDNSTVLTKQGLGSSCGDTDVDNCNLIYLYYLNSDPEQPLIFRPTQDCYPPGSTYKTTTLMATLDSGTLGLNDPVFYNDPNTNPYPQHLQAEGPVTVSGANGDSETFQPTISNILGYTKTFPVSLAYGFSHSDNIIYLEAGVKTGVDTWEKYNQAIYVGQEIPFDLPVKVSTVTKLPNLCTYQPQTYTPLTVSALAEDSFGQGYDFITPLQMMLVDNVAADDGKLMRPTVIQKIVDPKNGTVLQPFTPTLLRQVISAATAQGVRDAMYGVNSCGSGSLSAVRLSYPYTPWEVIGKTGTAQVPNVNGQVQPGDSWYITAAPYYYQSNDIPPITITAMKENGGEGAYANGPMLNAIYNQIFTQVMTNVHTNPVPPFENANDQSTLPFCNQTGLLQP